MSDTFGDDAWVEEYDRRRREEDFTGLDTVHSNRFGAFIHAALIAKWMRDHKLLEGLVLEKASKYERLPVKLKSRKTEIFAEI